MQPVALYIMDVIKAVDAAGYEAKSQKSPESLYEIFLVQQVVAEEQWGEYKGILMKYSLFSKLLLKNNGANTKAFLNHCRGRKSIKASFIGYKGTIK